MAVALDTANLNREGVRERAKWAETEEQAGRNRERERKQWDTSFSIVPLIDCTLSSLR